MAPARTVQGRVGSCYRIWQKSSPPTKPVKKRWPGQQEALALKRQADDRVRESRPNSRMIWPGAPGAQTEILAAAEARAAEIAAATARQVQDLTDQAKAPPGGGGGRRWSPGC